VGKRRDLFKFLTSRLVEIWQLIVLTDRAVSFDYREITQITIASDHFIHHRDYPRALRR